MDDLIRRYDAEADADLMICAARGVAYQRDMAADRVEYGRRYYEKCEAYERDEIARQVVASRVKLVNRHAGGDRAVLDIGAGSGAFARGRFATWGYDVNRATEERLRLEGRWSDEFKRFRAFCLWDTIEHVEDPDLYFRRMPEGAWLFASLPIFASITSIRQSKHYRPGEHLYYFTDRGLLNWMAEYRFRLVEYTEAEMKAGREQIGQFAFVRDLPGYHETAEQYRKLYEPHYGTSSRALYLEMIAPVVMECDPASVLDYGCGRSDLLAHFWADGRRRLAWYDPAVPGCQEMPDGEFDLVLCNDVLEHVRMQDVGRVLAELRAKSNRVLFTISLRPARAKLPDGRNAHVTLLSASEWTRWIAEAFDCPVQQHPTPWPHILMVTTF